MKNPSKALLASVPVFLAAQPRHAVSGQEKFEPIPKAVASQYRFNLARNFFASPEAEKQARKDIYAPLSELERLKGRVTASGANLYRAFRLSDEMELAFRRHDLYLFLRYAINTRDEAATKEADELREAVRRARRLLRQELLGMGEGAVARLTAREPRLKRYGFAVESARRRKPHTLSPKEEELLSAVAPLARGDFYEQVLSRINFGTVRTPTGELDVFRQQGELANHPDPAIRAEGRSKLFAGFASRRDLLAFGLTRMVEALHTLSRQRNFRNFPAEAYFDDGLTAEEVNAFYERVAQEAELYKRYERVRGGGPAGAGGSGVPRFAVGEATKIVREALAALGPEYSRELSSLLDPANGRMDIAGGDNRLPLQGTASVYPTGTSIFFAYNYEGYYIDVMLLAHESGHAVQAMLMGNNRVPMAYAAGPGYFTESFGVFNELLVADHLYRRATDPRGRVYFLEQLVGRATALFPSTAEAAIEQAIYDGVEQGRVAGADDLDALAKRVGSRYSSEYEKADEQKMVWAAMSEYYLAPMHQVNDPVASVLALKYYEMYKRAPAEFVPRYLSLLRNGYDAPPHALLKRFLGIDLRDPRLVPDAVGFLRSQVEALEELKKNIAARPA